MEDERNYAVFIASHIRYKGQLELLQKAIKSVKEQDYKGGIIDIWISISFENNFALEFDDLKIADTCFKCFKHKKKLFQLEHLKVLNDASYMNYNYDFIAFIDDDDTYEPNRISAFNNKNTEIEDNGDLSVETQVILEKALCTLNGVDAVDCLIYWCYIIKPDALNCFFKLFSEKSFNSNNADYLLKMFLEHLHCFNKDACIDNGYYNYNTENDNSISKIAKQKHSNKEVAFYYTCLNDKISLVKLYGINYKKNINKVLWKECFNNFHKYSEDEWRDFIFARLTKYSFEKYKNYFKPKMI